MEIAPGYTVRDWTCLELQCISSEDWSQAIRIFESRICRRFLDPVDLLIAHEMDKPRGTFGFAIMAVDCLVIETIQRFIEGRTQSGENGRLFRAFLSERLSSWFDDGVSNDSKADRFYRNCRCALHHSGQTDADLRLCRTGPLIRFDSDLGIIVNRTGFHEAIKCEFTRYLGDLSDGTDSRLRENFRRVMNALCGVEQTNGLHHHDD